MDILYFWEQSKTCTYHSNHEQSQINGIHLYKLYNKTNTWSKETIKSPSSKWTSWKKIEVQNNSWMVFKTCLVFSFPLKDGTEYFLS